MCLKVHVITQKSCIDFLALFMKNFLKGLGGPAGGQSLVDISPKKSSYNHDSNSHMLTNDVLNLNLDSSGGLV